MAVIYFGDTVTYSPRRIHHTLSRVCVSFQYQIVHDMTVWRVVNDG